MWLLGIVAFAGPMQIERMDVLEAHIHEKKCIERVKDAEKVGLPKNTNIGCVHVDGISKTKRENYEKNKKS